jgi:hypothetical protein
MGQTDSVFCTITSREMQRLRKQGFRRLEMGKLLEKGGDGIRNMAESIESGLVVTEQAAKASQIYYENFP